MTNEEMLNAFLKPRGMYYEGGCNLRILLPFFIMDAVYAIYNRSIKPLSLDPNGYPAERRERWRIAYNRFNKKFFDSFNEDQQDAIIDKMDSFEEYIANDLMVMQASVWRVLCKIEPERDSEVQNVAADCFLAEMLTCAALIESQRIINWAKTRPRQSGMGFEVVKLPKAFVSSYDGIDDVRLKINSFNNVYYQPTKDIVISNHQGISDAISQMIQKIFRFIKIDAIENTRADNEIHE